jgi:cytoskeletal protein RodZ
MRGERATLGKSLLDVQRELKIKATYIAAIENADVKAFESPGFIAGYVRSYARYLGMDPEWAFKAFCDESGFAPVHGLSGLAAAKGSTEKPIARSVEESLANPNASFVPRPSSIFEGIEPGAVGSVAVLVALIGVLGFGGWSVLRQIQKVDFAPVEQTVGVMDNLPDMGAGDTSGGAETAPTLAATPGEAVAGLEQAPSADALDRLYRPQALETPVLIARDGPISTLDPSQVGALAGDNAMAESGSAPARAAPAAADAATSAQPAVADAGAVKVFGPDAPQVAIFAVRPAWVRVRAADGTVILEKILDAGEKYVLPPLENPPILRTGNAGSVYFAVNGTAYGPAGVGASVVKNIALAPGPLTQKYQVADLKADKALADFVAVADASQ